MARTFYIDSETLDFVIEDGDIRMAEGDQVVVQSVQAVVITWIGEWVLDERHGTDYGPMTADSYDERAVKEAVTAAIYQVREVRSVQSVTVQRSGRQLIIGFTAAIESGAVISSEVGFGG